MNVCPVRETFVCVLVYKKLGVNLLPSYNISLGGLAPLKLGQTCFAQII